MLFLRKACYLDNQQQKSILQVKVYCTAFFPREFTPNAIARLSLSHVSARAQEHGKIRKDLRKQPPQINKCSNYNQTCKNYNTQHTEDFDSLLEGNSQIH